MKNFFFSKISDFFQKIIFEIMIFINKIKVEKKMDYHFDVEFCEESISGNHKCNAAMSDYVKDRTSKPKRKVDLKNAFGCLQKVSGAWSWKLYEFWFEKIYEKKSLSVFFFFIPKKYFLSELRKKLGHNFDVENCKLSIGEVFRAIPTL